MRWRATIREPDLHGIGPLVDCPSPIAVEG